MKNLTTAAAALGAVNTLNAHYPLGRGNVYRAIPSFAYGLVTSELPLHVIGAQAAGAFALRRHLTPLAGLLTAASWGGLLALEAEAREAPAVLDAALTEALGAAYRDRARHPRPAPAHTPGLVATWRAHGRYTKGTADIPYGPAGHRNMLDVWRREDLPSDARAPVLVQIHGGGWMTGDRTVQAYPLMSLMAELGWICVSVSYRLSPRATWPAQIDDVKAAIRWVKEHIAEHGGDPGFIAVTGGSAGGHLTMLAALDPELDVQAAAPFYGPPDWTNRSGYEHDLLGPALAEKIIKQPLNDETRELYELASPRDQIHPGAPPFFVLGAEQDNLVSPTDLREFAEELAATSEQPVAFAELPGAWHAWDLFSTTRARASARAVADFLGVVYAGTAS
jgi:acetyl esterase/lipase